MPVKKAFWLEQNNENDFLNHSWLYKSYHLYSAGNNHNKYKSKKLCPKEIKKYLTIYLDKKYDLNLIHSFENQKF